MGLCFTRDSNEVEDVDEPEEGVFRKPPHYRGREGPRYKVLNFTRDYEYRQYEPSTWICVRMNDIEYKKAISKGDSALAKYFEGKNGPEKTMTLTCPLRMHVEFRQDLDEPGYFVVSRHLPYENCERPPAPSQSNMFIQDYPQQFAYVSVFEGFTGEDQIKAKLKALTKVLENEGTDYEDTDYFVTKFENNLSLKRKVNEVIVVSESSE